MMSKLPDPDGEVRVRGVVAGAADAWTHASIRMVSGTASHQIASITSDCKHHIRLQASHQTPPPPKKKEEERAAHHSRNYRVSSADQFIRSQAPNHCPKMGKKLSIIGVKGTLNTTIQYIRL